MIEMILIYMIILVINVNVRYHSLEKSMIENNSLFIFIFILKIYYKSNISNRICFLEFTNNKMRHIAIWLTFSDKYTSILNLTKKVIWPKERKSDIISKRIILKAKNMEIYYK